MPAEGLDAVVNLSVNQTLSRTVITAGTTFLSVVALYVFGGEALRGFAFTMLVGIVAGTYSTVFIASAIAILLSGKPASRKAFRVRRSATRQRCRQPDSAYIHLRATKSGRLLTENQDDVDTHLVTNAVALTITLREKW